MERVKHNAALPKCRAQLLTRTMNGKWGKDRSSGHYTEYVNMSKWGEDKHREDMMLVEEAFIVMSNNLSCLLENACILWPV